MINYLVNIELLFRHINKDNTFSRLKLKKQMAANTDHPNLMFQFGISEVYKDIHALMIRSVIK